MDYKSLKDEISMIIWRATEMYEDGEDVTCGEVADNIIALIKSKPAPEINIKAIDGNVQISVNGEVLSKEE